MRHYELPYFLSLIKDPGRFLRLMLKLNESNPGACNDILQLMSGHQYLQLVQVFAHDADLRLSRGNRINAVPMLNALNNVGHFVSGNLNRLRRLISNVEDYAVDAQEAIEFMESELNISRCDDCGDWEYIDKLASAWGDEDICRSCIEENYTYLNRYETYVPSSNVVNARSEDGEIIQIHCDDEAFTWNEDLRTRVHEDWMPSEPEVIAGYHSSKGQFRIKRDDWTAAHKRYLGVELEVEMADRYAETGDKARQLNKLINDGEVGGNVFFERDGSLSNGFEIVTHPQSLPAHREMWKWLQDKAATKGLLSHKSTTCGLHVHVNRDSLTQLQIAKIVAFVNNPSNEEFMTALARRYGAAMTGYCRIKADKAAVKKPESSDRYEAVNVTPRHTIEFRIFKGTLKYESLVAAIEFVHALCEYTARCGDCSASDLGYESFLKFAETKLPKETKTLLAYINNRLETV